MSTRSAIGRVTGPGKFSAIYHHWDGYPTGLGATLWELYHTHFKKDIEAMLKFLIDDHPAGWSTINGADFSLPAGYNEDIGGREKPHGPSCFCHGGRNEEKGWVITEKNASGSGCEYVYAFTKKEGHNIMLVLSKDGNKMVGFFGFGDKKATWKQIAEIDLDGKAGPDARTKWSEIGP